jgi:carboxyl-terminal processing protease
MQTRIELKGGGVLMLTSGELIAPQGRSWDGIGLVSSLENLGQVFAR